MGSKSRVKDLDLWEELLRVMYHVQCYWGVQVAFWWVPPKWNKDVRIMAGMGLKVPLSHWIISNEMSKALREKGLQSSSSPGTRCVFALEMRPREDGHEPGNDSVECMFCWNWT